MRRKVLIRPFAMTKQLSLLPSNPWTRCLFARRSFLSLLPVLLFLLHAGSARADSFAVTYTVSQNADSTWQYAYTLSGNFSAGDDLAILFPYGSSSMLTDTSTTNADWMTFVLQPDALLPADGEFDAVANVRNPGLQQGFSASFLSLNSGVPGAQSFQLYDSAFNLVSSGTTTPAADADPGSTASILATPEPGSLTLLGTAALGLLPLVRRRLQAAG